MIEFLLSLAADFIGYLIFELIIAGMGKLIRGIYYTVREAITGKKREVSEVNRIETRFLRKKFKLKAPLNERIPKGTRGTVVQVIDEKNIFVEFENTNGTQITVDQKQLFKVKLKNIALE